MQKLKRKVEITNSRGCAGIFTEVSRIVQGSNKSSLEPLLKVA
jgi:AMMECR1 domain-containing protein